MSTPRCRSTNCSQGRRNASAAALSRRPAERRCASRCSATKAATALCFFSLPSRHHGRRAPSATAPSGMSCARCSRKLACNAAASPVALCSVNCGRKVAHEVVRHHSHAAHNAAARRALHGLELGESRRLHALEHLSRARVRPLCARRRRQQRPRARPCPPEKGQATRACRARARWPRRSARTCRRRPGSACAGPREIARSRAARRMRVAARRPHRCLSPCRRPRARLRWRRQCRAHPRGRACSLSWRLELTARAGADDEEQQMQRANGREEARKVEAGSGASAGAMPAVAARKARTGAGSRLAILMAVKC
jgi:hypothetical protein